MTVLVAVWTRWTLDEAERARTVDFGRRLRSVAGPALGVMVPATVLGAFAYGPLVLPLVAALVFVLFGLGWAIPRSDHPEVPLALALLAGQAVVVAFMAIARQFQLDGLGLLILPAAAACLLFPRRHTVLATLWSVGVMVGSAFAIDAARVIQEPPILLLPLGVMLCVVLPAAMVRALEIASRDTAMVDTLTGALNRGALEARIAELSAQAITLPLRVGVIMGDLDRFKLVNDELGHDAGDVVLKETVGRMRRVLGPLTPVYRVGGEEFAVLMAGAEEDEVGVVAERLRGAVRSEPMAERTVTMSFGIAAATLDRQPVGRIVEVADEALYASKRAGRDRVSVASAPSVDDAPGPQPESSSGVRTAPVEGGGVGSATVALGHDRGNWLVRSDFERDHLREMANGLSRTHHGALGFVFLALVASIPWLGIDFMLPAIPAVIAYHITERLIARMRRPELALGAAWLSVQLAIFAGALIVAEPEPYMLVLFAPMLIGMTAVFPTRGVLVNASITVALTFAAGAAARPDIVTADPGVFMPPMILVIGIALLSGVIGRSAVEFRTKAVLDPLTGLLTRAALRARLEEIGHESQGTSGAVSAVAFDIDAFKEHNDAHGHTHGDAVLRAVGDTVRRNLHALQWGFRVGGDEFLLVAPGGAGTAAALAEQLRVAIGQLVIDGVQVTASFGVAATVAGDRFDFDALARRADAALYEAKRAGRNRVAVAAPLAPGPSPLATVLRGAA